MVLNVDDLPLSIDHLLGEESKNRVAKVGVELEGAWTKLPLGAKLEIDNSVYKGTRIAGYQYGELPSGPMLPAAIPRFLKKYYPSAVDHTCGLHVHMSFDSLLRYAWLMSPRYPKTMVKYLSEWAKKEGFPADHHIWDRLSGKSIYCQDKFWPDEQVNYLLKDHDQKRHGHRYTIVNYCGRYKTVEIRVLPMMSIVAQAIRAVNMVIDITNACLVLLSEKERKLSGKFELPNGYTYEEIREKEIPLTSRQRKVILG